MPKDRGTVPPGGYCRYRDPDSGFEVAHPYYDWCKSLALDGRRARGLPIPHDWDAFFDAAFCAATPTGCVEVPHAVHERQQTWLSMAAQFTRAMVQWAQSGFRVTTWEQFKERQSTCQGAPATASAPAHERCPYFGHFPVFGLTKCNKCGCAGLKLWLATERCPADKWGPVA